MTHLLYRYLVSTPINPKYALFVCFLEYNRKQENQEVGSLAVENCTAIAAKCWQKSKGEQSYRASAVIYTYRFMSWVVALKRPSGRSVKRLLWSHLEKQKPNSSVRLCIPLTHIDQTGMRDLYIVHVHTTYTGRLSMQGISCNASLKPDCNFVRMWVGPLWMA